MFIRGFLCNKLMLCFMCMKNCTSQTGSFVVWYVTGWCWASYKRKSANPTSVGLLCVRECVYHVHDEPITSQIDKFVALYVTGWCWASCSWRRSCRCGLATLPQRPWWFPSCIPFSSNCDWISANRHQRHSKTSRPRMVVSIGNDDSVKASSMLEQYFHKCDITLQGSVYYCFVGDIINNCSLVRYFCLKLPPYTTFKLAFCVIINCYVNCYAYFFPTYVPSAVYSLC